MSLVSYGGTFSNINGFSRDRSNPNKCYKIIDRDMMILLYNYYFQEEILFDTIKQIRNGKIFSGELKIINKVADIIPKQDDIDSQIIDLLPHTLDYRILYGFCPFEMSIEETKYSLPNDNPIEDEEESEYESKETNTDDSSLAIHSSTKEEIESSSSSSKPKKENYRTEIFNRTKVTIPPLGTLSFVIEYDTSTNRLDIKALKRGVQCTAINGFDSSTSFEPSIFVYIWPDKMPGIQRDLFQSSIKKIFYLWQELKQFRSNILQCDYQTSHPSIFVSSKVIDDENSEGKTEEELAADHGITDLMDINPNYTISAKKMRSMDVITNKLNESNRGYDHAFSSINQDYVQAEESTRVHWLNPGDTIVHQIQPTTVANIQEFTKNYEETIRLMFQVPPSYINKSNSKFKTDTYVEKQAFRSAILKDRNHVSEVFAFIYNTCKAYEDDKNLVSMLVFLNEQKMEEMKQDSGLSSIGLTIDTPPIVNVVEERYAAALEGITSIMNDKNRYQLEFLEDPFSNEISIEEIIIASERGAITSEEEINFIRTRIGLKRVPDNHSLIKQKDTMKKREAHVNTHKEHSIHSRKRTHHEESYDE